MTIFRKIACYALLPFAVISLQYMMPENSPGKSDPKAVRIAAEVIRAMGGQKAWNDVHYLSWNFFGRRKLVWDKWKNIVRIDWLSTSRQVQVDLLNGTGYVELNGVPQTNPDTLSKYLEIGKKVWINDSYWLIMPFKLLDPGVVLKYAGREVMPDSNKADILELTFDNVGVTPQNKYRVWVDVKTKMVLKWAYYAKNTDKTPKIVNTWDDYRRYGNILLSGSRGEYGKLYPIDITDTVPSGTFR